MARIRSAVPHSPKAAGGYVWSRDVSFWSLLLVNLIFICVAFIENWNFFVMVWVYWFQGLVICFFSVLKILSVKKLSKEDTLFEVSVFKKPVFRYQPPAGSTTAKVLIAVFFSLTYGIYHIFYGVFIVFSTIFLVSYLGSSAGINVVDIVLPSILFFLNHLFSFIINFRRERERRALRRTFSQAYERILPMHFVTVMFGCATAYFIVSYNVTVLTLLFMLLKTLWDLDSHVKEHSMPQ